MVNKLISKSKAVYYSDQIKSCGSNQRELFKIVEGLNQGNVERQYPPSSSADALANQFADYLNNKIHAIMGDLLLKSFCCDNPLPESSLPQCEAILQCLEAVTCERLFKERLSVRGSYDLENFCEIE